MVYNPAAITPKPTSCAKPAPKPQAPICGTGHFGNAAHNARSATGQHVERRDGNRHQSGNHQQQGRPDNCAPKPQPKPMPPVNCHPKPMPKPMPPVFCGTKPTHGKPESHMGGHTGGHAGVKGEIRDTVRDLISRCNAHGGGKGHGSGQGSGQGSNANCASGGGSSSEIRDLVNQIRDLVSGMSNGGGKGSASSRGGSAASHGGGSHGSYGSHGGNNGSSDVKSLIGQIVKMLEKLLSGLGNGKSGAGMGGQGMGGQGMGGKGMGDMMSRLSDLCDKLENAGNSGSGRGRGGSNGGGYNGGQIGGGHGGGRGHHGAGQVQVGTRGNDVLVGTRGNDVQVGRKGNDVLIGKRGNDVQFGGRGNDVLKGGRGNDVQFGGRGNDVLKGGRGNDVQFGGRGNDTIFGGRGNDTIFGGRGNDIIKGGAGSDVIDGGKGIDTAVYDKNRDCYIVKNRDGSTMVVDRKTGDRDMLKNIEKLQFADKTENVGGSHKPEAKWTVSEVKDGKANINLGDRYSIALDEKNSVWTLTDKCDDSQTRVWGDPHVDVGNDGKTEFDFKKDATFQLEDGTKITVNTVPFGNTGQTMSSSLTITNGHNAIQVTGLGDKYDGANNLNITQSSNGRQLDRQTDDGAFTLKEAGKGWTLDGKTPTQQNINAAENKPVAAA